MAANSVARWFQWSSVIGRSERSADGIHLSAALTSPVSTTNRLARHKRTGPFLCRCMWRAAIFKAHPNRKDTRRPHSSRQTAVATTAHFSALLPFLFLFFVFFCTGVFTFFFASWENLQVQPGWAEGRLGGDWNFRVTSKSEVQKTTRGRIQWRI